MIPNFLRPEVLSYASVEIVRLPAPNAEADAEQLGRAAHAANLMCAPCLDPKLNTLLDSQRAPTIRIRILTAWLRGWTDANLAA